MKYFYKYKTASGIFDEKDFNKMIDHWAKNNIIIAHRYPGKGEDDLEILYLEDDTGQDMIIHV